MSSSEKDKAKGPKEQGHASREALDSLLHTLADEGEKALLNPSVAQPKKRGRKTNEERARLLAEALRKMRAAPKAPAAGEALSEGIAASSAKEMAALAAQAPASNAEAEAKAEAKPKRTRSKTTKTTTRKRSTSKTGTRASSKTSTESHEPALSPEEVAATLPFAFSSRGFKASLTSVEDEQGTPEDQGLIGEAGLVGGDAGLVSSLEAEAQTSKEEDPMASVEQVLAAAERALQAAKLSAQSPLDDDLEESTAPAEEACSLAESTDSVEQERPVEVVRSEDQQRASPRPAGEQVSRNGLPPQDGDATPAEQQERGEESQGEAEAKTPTAKVEPKRKRGRPRKMLQDADAIHKAEEEIYYDENGNPYTLEYYSFDHIDGVEMFKYVPNSVAKYDLYGDGHRKDEKRAPEVSQPERRFQVMKPKPKLISTSSNGVLLTLPENVRPHLKGDNTPPDLARKPKGDPREREEEVRIAALRAEVQASLDEVRACYGMNVADSALLNARVHEIAEDQKDKSVPPQQAQASDSQAQRVSTVMEEKEPKPDEMANPLLISSEDHEKIIDENFDFKEFMPEFAGFDDSECSFLKKKYMQGPADACARLLAGHRLEREGALAHKPLDVDEIHRLIHLCEKKTKLTPERIFELNQYFSNHMTTSESARLLTRLESMITEDAKAMYGNEKGILSSDALFATLLNKIQFLPNADYGTVIQLRYDIIDSYLTYEDFLYNELEGIDPETEQPRNADYSSQAFAEQCYYYYLLAEHYMQQKEIPEAMECYGYFHMLSELFNQINLFRVMRHGFTEQNDFEELKYCHSRATFTKRICYEQAVDLCGTDVFPWHFCYLRQEMWALVQTDFFDPMVLCDSLVNLISSLKEQALPLRHLPYQFDYLNSLHGFFLATKVEVACVDEVTVLLRQLLEAENAEETRTILLEIFTEEPEDKEKPQMEELAYITPFIEAEFNKLKGGIHYISTGLIDYAVYVCCKRACSRMLRPWIQRYSYLDLVGIGSAALAEGVIEKYIDVVTNTVLFHLNMVFDACSRYSIIKGQEWDLRTEKFLQQCVYDGCTLLAQQGYTLVANIAPRYDIVLLRLKLNAKVHFQHKDDPLYSDLRISGHLPVLASTPAHTAFLIGRSYSFGEHTPKSAVYGYTALAFADICGHALATVYMATLYHTLFDASLTASGETFLRLHLRALRAYGLGQVGFKDNESVPELLDFGRAAIFPCCHVMRESGYKKLYQQVLISKFPHIKEIVEKYNPTFHFEPESDTALRAQKRPVIYTILSNTILYAIELLEQRPDLFAVYKLSLCSLLRWQRAVMRKTVVPEGCLVMARLVASQVSFEHTYMVHDTEELGLSASSLSDLLFHQVMPKELWNYKNKDAFLDRQSNDRLTLASMFLQVAMTDPLLIEQATAIFDHFFVSLEGNFTPLVIPHLDKMASMAAAMHHGRSLSYLSEIHRCNGLDEKADAFALLGQRFCSNACYKPALQYYIKNDKAEQRLALAEQMVSLQHAYGFYEMYLCLKDNKERQQEAHSYLFYAARLNVPEALQQYASLRERELFRPLPFVTWFIALEAMADTNLYALMVLLLLTVDSALVPPSTARLIRLVETHQSFFTDPQMKRVIFDRGIIDSTKLVRLGVGVRSFIFSNFENEHDSLRNLSEDLNGNASTVKMLKELQQITIHGLSHITDIHDPKVSDLLTKINTCLEHPKSVLEYVIGCNWRQSSGYPSFFKPISNEEALDCLTSREDYKHCALETTCAEILSSFDFLDTSLGKQTGCLQYQSDSRTMCNTAYQICLNNEYSFESFFSSCTFSSTLMSLKALALSALRSPSYRPQPLIFSEVCRYLSNSGQSMARRLCTLDFSFLNEEPYGTLYQITHGAEVRKQSYKALTNHQTDLIIGNIGSIDKHKFWHSNQGFASVKFQAGVPLTGFELKSYPEIYAMPKKEKSFTEAILGKTPSWRTIDPVNIDVDALENEDFLQKDISPDEDFIHFIHQYLRWMPLEERGLKGHLNDAFFMLSFGSGFLNAILSMKSVWLLSKDGTQPLRSYSSRLASSFLKQDEEGARARYLTYSNSHYFRYSFGRAFKKVDPRNPKSSSSLFQEFMQKPYQSSLAKQLLDALAEEHNQPQESRWVFSTDIEDATSTGMPQEHLSLGRRLVRLTDEERFEASNKLLNFAVQLDTLCYGETWHMEETLARFQGRKKPTSAEEEAFERRNILAMLANDSLRVSSVLTDEDVDILFQHCRSQKFKQTFPLSFLNPNMPESDHLSFDTYLPLYGYTNVLQMRALKANLGPDYIDFTPNTAVQERMWRWTYTKEELLASTYSYSFLEKPSHNALELLQKSWSSYASANLEIDAARLQCFRAKQKQPQESTAPAQTKNEALSFISSAWGSGSNWGMLAGAQVSGWSQYSAYGKPSSLNVHKPFVVTTGSSHSFSYILHAHSIGKSLDPRFFGNIDYNFSVDLDKSVHKILEEHPELSHGDQISNDVFAEMKSITADLQQLLNETMGEEVPTGAPESLEQCPTQQGTRDQLDLFLGEIKRQLWVCRHQHYNQMFRPRIFGEIDNPLHEFIFACVREIALGTTFQQTAELETLVLNNLARIGYFYGAVDVIDMAFQATIMRAYEMRYSLNRYKDSFVLRYCNEMLMFLHKNFGSFESVEQFEHCSGKDPVKIINDYFAKKKPESILGPRPVCVLQTMDDVRMCMQSPFFAGFTLKYGWVVLAELFIQEPHYRALLEAPSYMLQHINVLKSECFLSPALFDFLQQPELIDSVGESNLSSMRYQSFLQIFDTFINALYFRDIYKQNVTFKKENRFFAPYEWSSTYSAMNHVLDILSRKRAKIGKASLQQQHAPFLLWKDRVLQNFMHSCFGEQWDIHLIDILDFMSDIFGKEVESIVNTSYIRHGTAAELKGYRYGINPDNPFRLPVLIADVYHNLYICSSCTESSSVTQKSACAQILKDNEEERKAAELEALYPESELTERKRQRAAQLYSLAKVVKPETSVDRARRAALEAKKRRRQQEDK